MYGVLHSEISNQQNERLTIWFVGNLTMWSVIQLSLVESIKRIETTLSNLAR